MSFGNRPQRLGPGKCHMYFSIFPWKDSPLGPWTIIEDSPGTYQSSPMVQGMREASVRTLLLLDCEWESGSVSRFSSVPDALEAMGFGKEVISLSSGGFKECSMFGSATKKWELSDGRVSL